MPFLFPTNKEIQQIGPDKVARMSENRLGFELMPERNVNAAVIQWDQKDNYSGLQQLRGLDGSPSCIKRVGQKRFSYTPGVYGEYDVIGETELTIRSGSTMSDVPIDITDLTVESHNFLIQRELDRKEWIIWTLLTTGTFAVTGPNGQASFTDTFALQTYARAVVWSDHANATPIADLMGLQLLGRGKGVQFNASSTIYFNRVAVNDLLSNTNAADLGGYRGQYGQTVTLDLSTVNKVLAGRDLPQIAIYDEGYYDDSNTFQLFIPNGKGVAMGKRADGSLIGEYLNTRNMNNDNGAPGPYEFIKDRTKGLNGEKTVPPNVEVHRGHNGGPTIYYPSSIVILTVN